MNSNENIIETRREISNKYYKNLLVCPMKYEKTKQNPMGYPPSSDFSEHAVNRRIYLQYKLNGYCNCESESCEYIHRIL